MTPLAQRPLATKALGGLVGLSVLMLTAPSTAAAGDLAIARRVAVETYPSAEQAPVSLPAPPRPRTTIRPSAPHRAALSTAEGFGLYAAVQGEAVDMTHPTALLRGPNGALFDEAAGLGWRRRNLSAVLGYMRPQNDRPLYMDESQTYHRPRGRVGIGLSLHY